MTDRKITHEVKLQKSVIVILAVLAIGVLANAVAPALEGKGAMAKIGAVGTYADPVFVRCVGGC